MIADLTRPESAQKDEALRDEALVARVVAGDTAAFEGIVRRWQSPLVNLAWRFCRDRGRAEEMAQEAFLRAFRNLAQFRGDSAFSTWLFSLATNLYRTEVRRMPAMPLSLARIRAAATIASRRAARRRLTFSVRR